MGEAFKQLEKTETASGEIRRADFSLESALDRAVLLAGKQELLVPLATQGLQEKLASGIDSIESLNTTAAALFRVDRSGIDLIAEQLDSSKPFFAAKQYRIADGREFWQLNDGRIVAARDGGEFEIWAPRGSGAESGRLVDLSPRSGTAANDNGGVLTLGSHDELHGTINDRGGRPILGGFSPNPEFTLNYRIQSPASIDVLNDLDLPSDRVEPASVAARRLISTNKQNYVSVHREVLVPRAGLPAGEHGYFESLAPQIIQERMYRVLSAPQMIELAELEEKLSEKKISEAQYISAKEELSSRAIAVLYPEELARALDKERGLRELARLNPDAIGELDGGPEAVERFREQILEARRVLYASPTSRLLLPEEWGQLLDILPDRSKVKELQVRNWEYPGNRQALMTALPKMGIVQVWGRTDSFQSPMMMILMHEWSHLTEPSYQAYVDAFSKAERLESSLLRPYAGKPGESWSVQFGEGILAANSETFVKFVHDAPLRGLIAGLALKQILQDIPSGQESRFHEKLKFRLEIIEGVSKPLVKAKLQALLQVSRNTDIDFVSFHEIADSILKIPDGKELLRSVFSQAELLKEHESHLHDPAKGIDPGLRKLAEMNLFARIYPELETGRFYSQKVSLANWINMKLDALAPPDQSAMLRDIFRRFPLDTMGLSHLISSERISSLLEKSSDFFEAGELFRRLSHQEKSAGNQVGVHELVMKHLDPNSKAWEDASRVGLSGEGSRQIAAVLNRLSENNYSATDGAYHKLAQIISDLNQGDLSRLRTGLLSPAESLIPVLRLAAVQQLAERGLLKEKPELVADTELKMKIIREDFKRLLQSAFGSTDLSRLEAIRSELSAVTEQSGAFSSYFSKKFQLPELLSELSVEAGFPVDGSRRPGAVEQKLQIQKLPPNLNPLAQNILSERSAVRIIDRVIDAGSQINEAKGGAKPVKQSEILDLPRNSRSGGQVLLKGGGAIVGLGVLGLPAIELFRKGSRVLQDMEPVKLNGH